MKAVLLLVWYFELVVEVAGLAVLRVGFQDRLVEEVLAILLMLSRR